MGAAFISVVDYPMCCGGYTNASRRWKMLLHCCAAECDAGQHRFANGLHNGRLDPNNNQCMAL